VKTFSFLNIFCHALGKNVIPISIEDEVGQLAFDIRALWHLTFRKEKPEELEPELREILSQMIEKDFSEWSRKQFWKEILGDSGVSIFTGALDNKEVDREMISDWDLR
jgi:hypothetical protein